MTLQISLPDEARRRLARWCATRVPGAERGRRQIGYVVHGGSVTVIERRAPRYPELDIAWSSEPLARLRLVDERAGRWAPFRYDGASGEWYPAGEPGLDPVALLVAAVQKEAEDRRRYPTAAAPE